MKDEKRLLWPKSELMLTLTLNLLGLAFLSVVFSVIGQVVNSAELIHFTDVAWKVTFLGFLVMMALGFLTGALTDGDTK